MHELLKIHVQQPIRANEHIRANPPIRRHIAARKSQPAVNRVIADGNADLLACLGGEAGTKLVRMSGAREEEQS